MTYPILLTLVVLVMLLLRQNLIVILMVLGASVQMLYSDGDLLFMAEDFWAALDREVLLSIPVFLLCGSIMSRGAIAERLVMVLKALTGSLSGGLGVAVILSSAFFCSNLRLIHGHAAGRWSSPLSGFEGAGLFNSLLSWGFDQRGNVGCSDSAQYSHDRLWSGHRNIYHRHVFSWPHPRAFAHAPSGTLFCMDK